MAARKKNRPAGPLERAGQTDDRVGQLTLLRVWKAMLAVVRRGLRLLDHGVARARGLGLVASISVLGIAAIALAWWVLREPPAAHVSDETEALARVIRSEAGIQSLQSRLHVAWATRNLAAERKQSIAEMACSPCGEQGKGRPVASKQEARDIDRRLAAGVLESDPLLDPTGGATHFINPALQDRLASEGRSGYRGRSYDVVKRRWRQVYGWERYYRLGRDLEFWGPPR